MDEACATTKMHADKQIEVGNEENGCIITPKDVIVGPRHVAQVFSPNHARVRVRMSIVFII
jgi:hypothetical protein